MIKKEQEILKKEYSPFTPGSPVPVELFVGRADKIKELLRYIKQASTGRQENVFLTGDRGLGKSSLVSFLRHFVNTQQSSDENEVIDLLGVHVFLGRVNSLESMVQHIFEEILKESQKHKWAKEVIDFFGERIKEIGLFGISVSFSPSETDTKELVRNFPKALNNLLNKIKKHKKGLFIALDDINGLAEQEDFANWYKSFVDEVATHYSDFPVFITLVGLPEKRVSLSKLQPSLMRIFRVIEIEKLADEEVEDFFYNAFKSVDIEVLPDALKIMVRYSSGLPTLMHEIGDATYWIDEDGIISVDDAWQGVLRAAERVGAEYFDPTVYHTIRSERYKSILKKLAELGLARCFSKKELEAKLNENEKKVFNNFLKRFRDLGVIENDLEKGRGSYRFVNEIYPIYIALEFGKTK